MKKHLWKIAFVTCLVMLAIFAVLLISNSIILSNIAANGLSMIEYLNSVKTDTILLFIFGIGAIIFKSIEICKKEKIKMKVTTAEP